MSFFEERICSLSLCIDVGDRRTLIQRMTLIRLHGIGVCRLACIPGSMLLKVIGHGRKKRRKKKKKGAWKRDRVDLI